MNISVIVPVHNTEQYLYECLNSILSQNGVSFEVVLVNDGSTDNSLSVIRDFEKRFKNISVIDQENLGPGHSRNQGIDHSSAEYIMFVDSDDIIPPGTLKEMYLRAIEADADIVTGKMKRFTSDTSVLFDSKLHTQFNKITEGVTDLNRSLALIYDTSPCNKLFKSKFWKDNQFAFEVRRFYEDVDLITIALLKARKIYVIDRVVYYWRIRTAGPRSTTQKRMDVSNLLDRIYVINKLKKVLEQNNNGHILRCFNDKILMHDLPLYLRHIEQATEEYSRIIWEEFFALIDSKFISNFSNLSLSSKIFYSLYVENDLESYRKISNLLRKVTSKFKSNLLKRLSRLIIFALITPSKTLKVICAG